ncbi:tubulin folding cofactor A [Emydomyces testavorans]|uniref:Tubulin-specific chaperone A n=1 Tax=Emydomyces testavorans TaxID=2070801 RepID=A0AAF0IKH8_9EURO|nr:tubulin folding cofactor A [Emydomyces testavorans]
MQRPQAKGLSPIAKTISTLDRLVREEASYHVELQEQGMRVLKTEEQVKKLAAHPEDEGNAVWMLRQERMAYEETKNVMSKMEQLAREAMEKLQGLVIDERHRGIDHVIRCTQRAEQAKEGDIDETAIQEAMETIRRAKEAMPSLSEPVSES